MSRSFDKILVRRIREVFDNYREPVDPAAWKDMERRLNHRSRLRVVYMGRVAGVAALLLVLMLIFRPFESRREAAPSMEQVVESDTETPAGSQAPQESVAANERQEKSDEQGDDPERILASEKKDVGGVQEKTEHKSGDSDRIDKADAVDLLIAERQDDQSQNIEDRQASGEIRKRSVLISRITPASESNVALDQAKGSNAPETLLAQFDQPGDPSVWENLPDQPVSREKNKPMELEVEFSTLYNYSSSMIASEVNFAGGVISEFQVLPNLTLSTGLVVSRQYFTTGKQSRGLTSYLSANSSYSRTDELAQFDENLADGVYPHFRDVSNKVKLIGLDVPVNIEYRINKVSLSAGISSFTYLQEKYRHDFTSNYVVYEYDTENNIVGTNKVAQNESVSETYNPLGKMDLASVLNVAVGYHFDVGQTRLVVEPFMKHPLGDLASRDIRFGARGIRLRVGF